MNDKLRKSPIRHQTSIEIKEVMEDQISSLLADVLDYGEMEKTGNKMLK